jgi:hypothetical protein
MCVRKNGLLFLFMKIVLDEYTYGQNAEYVYSVWFVYIGTTAF